MTRFSGILHSDGWNGYQQVEEQGVTFCGCWAHARIKFKQALIAASSGNEDIPESVALSYCNQLFAIEKRAEEMTAKERYALQQKESKPLLEAFLTDGRIKISNNRAERSITSYIIGRKNWLFCNPPGGTKSSATIYSLIQTAMKNG